MAKSEATLAAPAASPQVLEAPLLRYRPQSPRHYRPRIGLVGCGGVTVWHLKAYLQEGYEVVGFYDIDQEKAELLRDTYYPEGEVYASLDELLGRVDIDVVDVATHPPVRPPLITAALEAGKHVLSQKPFVEDIAVGRALAELADRQGVWLAVNQNGRWAPHWSYARQAVAAGLLGELSAVHFDVHWDHSWVKDTAFENVRHLVLYDFAIHWFDILCCLMEDRKPLRVYASFSPSKTQDVRPNLLGQAVVEYEGAQASLIFDADTRFGAWETTYIAGSHGSIRCEGIDSKQQQLEMHSHEGVALPNLEGSWFPDGFAGTMGELLCAIEEERAPSNSAHNNLVSLALCFAAVASAERKEPVVPGTVNSLAEAEGGGALVAG